MKTSDPNAASARKHEHVFATLRREIAEGRWRPGERLPSEAELVQRFGLSRITVGRAVRDLAQAGVVERRAGSGTFVRAADAAPRGHAFGLLIPNLGETEIFEPICRGMMTASRARDHALLWGSAQQAGDTPPVAEASPADAAQREQQALALCRHYVERGVAGVFFAPLEFAPSSRETNRRIARELDAAGIPLVLLDRPIGAYPEPASHDLVGIDNRRAGFVVTSHLVARGCRRIAFVGVPRAAETVAAREAGYREAIFQARGAYEPALAARLDPDDDDAVRSFLDRTRPDGIVCANDRVAGRLLHALRRLAVRVPDEVRLVGIDDVEYAGLLPVPLTTLRQPVRRIGELALTIMLERLTHPGMPPRDTRLPCELVVRESCGGAR